MATADLTPTHSTPALAHLAHSAHNIGKLRRFCDRQGIKDCSLHRQRMKLEGMILPVFKEALERHGTHSWVEYVNKEPEAAAGLFDSHPGLLSSLLLAMRIVESGYVDLRRTNQSDPDLIGVIYRCFPSGISGDPSDLDGVIIYRKEDWQAQSLATRICDDYPEVETGSVPGHRFGLQGSARYAALHH
jgi:hypothetical protein